MQGNYTSMLLSEHLLVFTTSGLDELLISPTSWSNSCRSEGEASEAAGSFSQVGLPVSVNQPGLVRLQDRLELDSIMNVVMEEKVVVVGMGEEGYA